MHPLCTVLCAFASPLGLLRATGVSHSARAIHWHHHLQGGNEVTGHAVPGDGVTGCAVTGSAVTGCVVPGTGPSLRCTCSPEPCCWTICAALRWDRFAATVSHLCSPLPFLSLPSPSSLPPPAASSLPSGPCGECGVSGVGGLRRRPRGSASVCGECLGAQAAGSSADRIRGHGVFQSPFLGIPGIHRWHHALHRAEPPPLRLELLCGHPRGFVPPLSPASS